jgi:hypothetical protein
MNPFVKLKYKAAVPKARLPGVGPALSEDELQRHIDEVHLRTLRRATAAMEAALHGPRTPGFENCDGFDPFTW